ncbi:MAG: WD40/YVTN/BNR-like repeat-containing protein [Halobacterium sp.]
MRLLAAYPDRVLAWTDGDYETVFEGDVHCLDAGPAGVYAGTPDGVVRETEDGWRTVAHVGDVTAVAVDGLVAWAGTEPSGVYHAADGRSFAACPGLTDLDSSDDWAFPPRPSTHHVRWLEPAPERLYVAVEAGALVRTEDGGDTWRDRVPSGPYDTHSMATHADEPGLAYAAAGDGFYVTEDGGDTWRTEEAGLDRTYCWSVVCDPGDPDRLLVSAAHGPRQAHDAGTAESAVYRRDPDGDRDGEGAGDGGGNGTGAREWTRCEGLPGPEGLLAATLATTGESGVAYAATNRGVYRTPDWGDTWTELAGDWPTALASERPRSLAVA